jgi:hypothetical protein
VVGHDDKAVELELGGVSITEEGCDHEFRGGGLLEDAVALVGDGGEGVGAGLKAHALRWRSLKLLAWRGRHTSGAKAQIIACP